MTEVSRSYGNEITVISTNTQLFLSDLIAGFLLELNLLRISPSEDHLHPINVVAAIIELLSSPNIPDEVRKS